LDIFFIIVFIGALIKGYRTGFIVAVFSLFAFIAGLAAALKLSAWVALKLSDHVKTSEKWLPVISFIIVFIAVALLVRLGAKLIQKTFEMAMLGWLNRLSGMALFVLLYALILSVFLFYAVQVRLVLPESLDKSTLYPYLQPLAPKFIKILGDIIPWFKGLFEQLQNYFNQWAAAH